MLNTLEDVEKYLQSLRESLDFSIKTSEICNEANHSSLTTEIIFNNFGTLHLTLIKKMSLVTIRGVYTSRKGKTIEDNTMVQLSNSMTKHKISSFILELRIGGDSL